jgi:uncharacterized protein (TIGR04255 family)
MAPAANRPSDLPNFLNPPLVETVLALQFEPIRGLTAAHLGLLWERLREHRQLPIIEEHPPLEPVIETFELPSAPRRLEITIQERPPIPRSWFLNDQKTELVQVQADRFIHNWRKLQSPEPYKRYEPIREAFMGEVVILQQFLKDERLGPLVLSQCEVTYLNHIEPSGVWERHCQLDLVLQHWKSSSDGAFLPESEGINLQQRVVIQSEEGRPLGRLHVVIEPAWKKIDRSPILTMNLTARGAPLGDGIEGAFAFFDLGRRWIVKAFTELTTPAMWRAWGRTDG